MLLLFLGLFVTQAFAQQATIVGTVFDPSAALVANAKVTITQVETASAHQYLTNNDGNYTAANLPIGHYKIVVDATGFKRVEQNDIVLNVGDRTRYDFRLQVGSTSDQVTVEGTAVGVQTDSGEVSGVITGKQVESLATNGRSIYTLINQTTGASSLQGDFQTPTPVGGDANVSFNGQRMGHNIYLLDGGEALDRGGSGTFAVMPSLESMSEFRALTSNYSADYGLSSAATLSTVIKSGSQTFHASAWEYNRNNVFDARNYFNPAPQQVAKLNFNTFGFNTGGEVPWGKSHPTFFFYNMEWRYLVQGGNYNQTVPLPSTYGGDFGATPINVPTTAQVAPSVLFAGCGGTAPTGIVQGQPFPNNTIPSCMLNANAQALLKSGIFPPPTNGTQFQGTPSTPTDVREEIVRIDHQFSSKDQIFGHYVAEQISQGFGTTMWSGDNVPTVGNTFGNPSYSAVVSYTRTISDTLLNEVTFNYSGNRINITPTGTYTAPSGFTFNRIYNGTNDLNRIPSIQLSGSTGTNYTSNWVPWNNGYNAYQILDAVSWSKGAHQLKMGGSFQTYRKYQDLFAPTQGSFQFNGSYSGNDFADYLLGLSNNYSENALQDSQNWNANSYALYIQDNWRATRRLTLNLGLRWDGIPHTVNPQGQVSNFYPNLYVPGNAPTWLTPGLVISPASAGLGTSPLPALQGYQFYLNGIGSAGQNGIPQGLVANHWAIFGPRLGFAYDIFGDGKTVFRGGFGIMYERVQGNDMYNAGPNQPYSANVGVNGVSLSNPKTNLATGNSLVEPPLPILVGNITGLLYNNYTPPYVYQYSLGIQRAVTARTVFNLSYVGSLNRHQNDYQNVNLPAYNSLPTILASSQQTAAYNLAVPYQGFASLNMSQNQASGSYNSLQTSFSGQVNNDLQLNVGYTWSKSIDSVSGTGSGNDLASVSNPYAGWRYDLGPSLFDRTHIFFVNFVYNIPWLRNSSNFAMKTFVGGWQVSAIIQAVSGAPINITTNNSVDGVSSVCNVVPNCTNRPDLIAPITYAHTVNSWFSTSSFAAPAPGTWGDLGNNALRGPGRDNWNASLFKAFVINEKRGSQFQFRVDVFNLWNHTQFKGSVQTGGIVTNLGASNFGQVTAAYDPRTLQLGAKLVF
ncbi:MAG TPA: TonB-dependent receptor [Candidatus Angelobacter sp.]|nr:TonB-dependent receptor [Candidatus Angelobacter sp.]